MMRVPLASKFCEPVNAIIGKDASKWLDFLWIDLLNPMTKGLALLRRDRIFTTQLRQEYVVGNMKK
jgi:hypothetical protein